MSDLSNVTFKNPSNEQIKALLSKLAYENLSMSFNFDNLDSSKFSIVEKNYLKENFQVLSVSDNTIYTSGFQGCFLKNTKTNENIFCIRGTELTDTGDLFADTQLQNIGMALTQFIDAYNYYIRTVTTVNSTAKVINFTSEKPPEGVAYVSDLMNYIYLEDFVGSEKGISNISMTGHSLGGHLAALLGVVTGKDATIFNSPGYKEKLPLGTFFVGENGATENIQSLISGIIGNLFNKDMASQNNITHIYNENGFEFIANMFTDWNNSTPIYCLQKEKSSHSIDEICTSYYAYETIKDITTGAGSFFNNSTLTTSGEAFDNVYKAYCLNENITYQTLDFANYTYVNSLISSIQIWSDNLKKNNTSIKVDSFNHSTSLPITGTSGSDIIYTGGGNDTVNSGRGNDTVYGIDLNGDILDSAVSVKTINLGDGNDKYTGSVGVDKVWSGSGDDIINTGAGKDIVYTTDGFSTDINTVNLGSGDDTFFGGAGIDIVDGGRFNV